MKISYLRSYITQHRCNTIEQVIYHLMANATPAQIEQKILLVVHVTQIAGRAPMAVKDRRWRKVARSLTPKPIKRKSKKKQT